LHRIVLLGKGRQEPLNPKHTKKNTKHANKEEKKTKKNFLMMKGGKEKEVRGLVYRNMKGRKRGEYLNTKPYGTKSRD